MATSAYATTGPESVITVKINYDGCTRRAKMVLRDMVPGQLEQQVRTFLRIPTENELTIERYSDSAGSYIVLENANVAVYKQLYRAAKAKSKLKLRVTKPNSDDKPAPRPVTVEEVSEAASSSAETLQDDKTTATIKTEETSPSPAIPQQPTPTPKNPVEVTLPLRSGPISRIYDGDALTKAAQQIAEFEHMRNDLTRRLDSISQKMPELPAMPKLPTRSTCPSGNSKDQARRPVACPRVSLGDVGFCTRNTQGFAVCCNSCDKTMPDVHYHCSTCDDGDFDLCSDCVDKGITCHSPSHWMIKRTTINGQIVNSTTEVLPPKTKKQTTPKDQEKPKLSEVPKPEACLPMLDPFCYDGDFTPSHHSFQPSSFPAMRTCNNCIATCPEVDFLHCTSCEDFDLCRTCFTKNAHGHHPMHRFAPAVADAKMSEAINVKLAPGRNQRHHAVCDGCDSFIFGVRHKCLDCPDWDYCSSCHPNASFVHPGHRFVPIYTPLSEAASTMNRSTHPGICCDGPLCANEKGYPVYIRGIRYKCAVCDDVDFCANCEANPNTAHNKTHPLIKIQSPIRNISVTTTGEKGDGSPMRAMGDSPPARRSLTPAKTAPPKKSTVKAAPAPVQEKKAETPKPVEALKQIAAPAKVEATSPLTQLTQFCAPEAKEQNLNAIFVRDTVIDGTIMPPNHAFEQSWVLRNDGTTQWPAGCSVKYVGGDYMGHVDSNHPAEISKLVSASESIVCYDSLAPGQEFAFTVLLRTPSRSGKFVSYWRLSTPEGLKFGHRLWCDVVVREVKVEEPKAVLKELVAQDSTTISKAPVVVEETLAVEEADESSLASSRMIFPKLEKESPAASMHEHTRAPSTIAPSTIADDKISSTGVPDESAEDEDWDVSEDGFLTDEEYDILDASDEELLEEQAKKTQK